MNGMVHPLVIAGAIGVLVSVLKNFNVGKKWYVLAAVVLGMIYFIPFAINGGITYTTALMNGLTAGGTASGVYSGIKTLANGSRKIDRVINPLAFNRGGNHE